jgi:hypothetical protein
MPSKSHSRCRHYIYILPFFFFTSSGWDRLYMSTFTYIYPTHRPHRHSIIISIPSRTGELQRRFQHAQIPRRNLTQLLFYRILNLNYLPGNDVVPRIRGGRLIMIHVYGSCAVSVARSCPGPTITSSATLAATHA